MLDALIYCSLAESKTEARRLIEQNAVHDLSSDAAHTDPFEKIVDAMELKVGKRRFVRIEVK